ncbi:MAG: hypothetical protein WBB25_12240 [Sulfitobacter sp.]
MSDETLYYPTQKVTDKDTCFFYHTVDLKNGETVNGNWDIRGREDAYFGGVDFTGKKALDVGCATGFLTYAMEQAGADVTSLELGPGATMSRDFVPFAAHDYHEHVNQSREQRSADQKSQDDFSDAAQAELHKKQIDRMAKGAEGTTSKGVGEKYVDSPYTKVKSLGDQHRGYWYCHTANDSNAKVVYRSVYEMPRDMGPFDVTMYGAILLHLRDPFFALHNGCRLTEKTVIVTDMLHARFKDRKNHPMTMFVPSVKDKSRIGTFWLFSPEIIVQMLGVLGFEDSTVTYHTQKARGIEVDMFTVVAHRTAPFNPAMTY